MYIAGGRRQVGLVVNVPSSTYTDSIYHSSAVYSAIPNQGLYEYVAAVGAQGNQMTTYYASNAYGQAESTENKISKFYYIAYATNAVIPAGTYIEIWGVRA